MTTSEIIAALPSLSSAELARVQAKLRELHPGGDDVRQRRVFSPRLAHPDQSPDFVKQVVEIATDAKL